VRVRATVVSLVAIAALLLMSAVALAGEGLVRGTQDSDMLTMSDGNDRVFARGGDDTVDGGAGHDSVRGGSGADALLGGEGDDRLKGGQGEDRLDGGDGDDVLNGRGDGRDKDEIVCGAGYDVVKLGSGDVADDDCEKVKRRKAAHQPKRRESCGAESGGCEDELVEEACVARYTPRCDDPEVLKPEPGQPVEQLAPDEPA
jgi:RTX calcium-binding nonapeptide repeat (4 copies)